MTPVRNTTGTAYDWEATLIGTGVLYIGLSGSSTTPLVSDTSLAGEFARLSATYAHTSGTSSLTLTITYTAVATVTIRTLGVFSGASGGSPLFEILLDADHILSPGQPITFTITLNL
jgi:hypothetical protein